MAAPTPTGTATTAVKIIRYVVPTRAARMPASSGFREGKLVRNCQLNRPAPSMTASRRRAASVARTITRVATAAPLKRRSVQCRRGKIQDKCTEEEHRADRKDRSVLQRSSRCISQADLNDVGGHGFNRDEGI